MKRCLILGGGISGKAAERLAYQIGLEPTVRSDGNDLDATKAVEGFELIIVSPGVNPLKSALYQAALRRTEAGVAELIGEMEFGYRALPKPKQLLAITGTNGKTTTTELTCWLLRALQIKAVPAGNIGCPLSEITCKILEGKLDSDALPVVETSSFQLERIRDFTPTAAVILNLASDHIDRYAGGFPEYCLTKFRIFQSVRPENQLLGLSLGIPTTRRVCVSGNDLFVDGRYLTGLLDTPLNTQHNRENLIAAIELALRIVPLEPIFSAEFIRAIHDFTPGKHRLETVAVQGGITFINDSKATNPAAVIAALKSLPEAGRPNIVILLGGLDKGMDFTPLAVWKNRIKLAVIFGECRNRIAHAIAGAFPTVDCGCDFDLAFKVAGQNACPGDIILLSPACASMDMFKDYQERGMHFTQLAQNRF